MKMKCRQFRLDLEEQRQRRPRCRIEAELYNRRLRNTQVITGSQGPVIGIVDCSKITGNLCKSKIDRGPSESTVSSSENNSLLSRSSKERVDLLELLPRQRVPLNGNRPSKMGQKIFFKDELTRQKTPKGIERPCSAPCEPPFYIKCSKKRNPRHVFLECIFPETHCAEQNRQRLLKLNPQCRRKPIPLKKSRSDTSTNAVQRSSNFKESKSVIFDCTEKVDTREIYTSTANSLKHSPPQVVLDEETEVEEKVKDINSPTLSKASMNNRLRSDTSLKECPLPVTPRNSREIRNTCGGFHPRKQAFQHSEAIEVKNECPNDLSLINKSSAVPSYVHEVKTNAHCHNEGKCAEGTSVKDIVMIPSAEVPVGTEHVRAVRQSQLSCINNTKQTPHISIPEEPNIDKVYQCTAVATPNFVNPNEVVGSKDEKSISASAEKSSLATNRQELNISSCTMCTQVDENMIAFSVNRDERKVKRDLCLKEMVARWSENAVERQMSMNSIGNGAPLRQKKFYWRLDASSKKEDSCGIDDRQRYWSEGNRSNNAVARLVNQREHRSQQVYASCRSNCVMADHCHHRCSYVECGRCPAEYLETAWKDVNDLPPQKCAKKLADVNPKNRLVIDTREEHLSNRANFTMIRVNQSERSELHRQSYFRHHVCCDGKSTGQYEYIKNSLYDVASHFQRPRSNVFQGLTNNCFSHDCPCRHHVCPNNTPKTSCRCRGSSSSPRRVTFCLPNDNPLFHVCNSRKLKIPEQPICLRDRCANSTQKEIRNDENKDRNIQLRGFAKISKNQQVECKNVRTTGQAQLSEQEPRSFVKDARKFFCEEIVDKQHNLMGANVPRKWPDSAQAKEIHNEKCRPTDHPRKYDESTADAQDEQQSLPTYAKVLAVFQRNCEKSAARQSGTKDRPIACKPINGDTSGDYRQRQLFLHTYSSGNFEYLFAAHTKSHQLYEDFNPHVTMQSNGSEGISENGVDKTGWTVGLINGKFKYLTAETFGFKINANGSSLKKKQLWTLEGSEHQVFLRSHLDRYLAVDQFGNVTCEAEDPSDPGCAFQIQLASDGSGRWALKNVQRGYFLGSSQDELKCTAKAPGEAEYWLVHLAARPQVNLRSAGRKRFAHLSAAQDEIHVDAPVPWGEDTLFTLEFRPASMDQDDGRGNQTKSEGGHYALHTCNNKYLAHDGKLLDTCTRDCLYAAEFHAGLLALRDIHGAYLAPIGSKAVLKSRSTTVTRDELFSLEESLPQASFVAALNQRYVSVKQGVDVTANQDEISGHETFQLEFDRVTKRWYIRTMQDRYWSLEAGGGIQASEHKRSSNALFDLVWQSEDGTVALRANNGKFLATKRSGHLYANADAPSGGDSDACKYYFYLMNRPVLVLRCEQGFVGPKSAASAKLECNKAGYETIRVERCERGVVRFKGQNGKYWHADSEGVTVDSDMPSDGFYLELREPSRICIKCTDGRYLTAGKNGALRLGETDYDSATKWEF